MASNDRASPGQVTYGARSPPALRLLAYGHARASQKLEEYQTPGSGTATMMDGQMSTDPRHETLARTWTRRRIRFVFSAMLLCQAHGQAQSGPQPPCGKETVPPYPGLDSSPIVKFWSESDFGHDWRPPGCTS